MQRSDSATSRSSDAGLATAKHSLRATLRGKRRARAGTRSSSQREADSARVAAHLAEHPQIQTARCIALYEALPTEEDVAPLVELAPQAKRFLVPITLEDRDLSWRDLHSGEDLGQHGIGMAEVIVVPALAIGPAGERLGQGGGSYDRALPRRTAGTSIVAVVFPDEVGLDIPVEQHDERVDAVATSERLIIF